MEYGKTITLEGSFEDVVPRVKAAFKLQGIADDAGARVTRALDTLTGPPPGRATNPKMEVA